MVEDSETEVNIENFRQYLDLVLRYKYIILSVILLFLIIGVVTYKLEVPVYSSSATLVAESEAADTSKYSFKATIDSNVVAELAKSSETISQVIKELGLLERKIIPDVYTSLKIKWGLANDPYTSFLARVRYYRDNIEVKSSGDQGKIIRITATDQNPKDSADIANKIAEIVLDKINRERDSQMSKSMRYIDEQLNAIRSLLSEDRKRFIDLQMSETYNSVIELNEKIQEEEKLIKQYNEKVRFYDTKLVLEFSSIPSSVNKTKFNEDKEKYENERDYYKEEVARLTNELIADKDSYSNLDKTDFYKAKELESIVVLDEKIYEGLLDDKQSMIISELFSPMPLRFLSRGWTPTAPSQFKGIKNIFFLLGFGIIVSTGLIFVFQFFDRRFSTVEQVEEELGLKVLGNIPRIKQKEDEKIANLVASPNVEAYKTLRTNIHFADKHGRLKVLGITSAEANTGKSYTIKNLANIMAGSKDKILIIDCDLRRPSLHLYFKIKRKPGLTDILTNDAKLEDAIVRVKKNLYVLPAGSLHYNPQQVLESRKMRELLKEVRESYDKVLCDSIPVLTASDAELLASLVDSNIFVINLKKSKKEEVIKAKKLLNNIRVPILGVILNNKKNSKKKYYQYSEAYKK